VQVNTLQYMLPFNGSVLNKLSDKPQVTLPVNVKVIAVSSSRLNVWLTELMLGFFL